MACRLTSAEPLSESMLEYYCFIEENTFENVVCEMSAILSQPQCVKASKLQQNRVHVFNDVQYLSPKPMPLFTKRTNVLLQDLVVSPSCEIRVWILRMALIFDRYLDKSAVEMPEKFENDTIIMISNITA